MTFTASWHKIFDADPRIGFLAQARALAAGPATAATARLIFNNRLDAVVTATLVLMVSLVRHRVGADMDRRPERPDARRRVKETPFVMTRMAEEHS